MGINFTKKQMINLRKVKSSDLIMLFLWRNNTEIVSLSASQKKVTLDEHNQWLNASINDVNKIIYIIEKDQVALGQLRFDRVKEKSNCEVSIYHAGLRQLPTISPLRLRLRARPSCPRPRACDIQEGAAATSICFTNT